MTNKEAIKFLKQLYPNGGHCWLDEQRMEAISMAIKALQEEPVSEEQVKKDTMTISKEWFEHCKKSWYNEGYIDGEYNRDRQFEKPVSEDLEEAATLYAKEEYSRKNPATLPNRCVGCYAPLMYAFKAGAKWQKEHLWKPADGDDLPEIDREVIALLDNGKVVFAHRPSEYWDGKNIDTGKITRYYPKIFDKGGWNIHNIVYWLNVELPKEIEL